jgi:hypothetical protein
VIILSGNTKVLGWISLDAEGNPHRKVRSGYHRGKTKRLNGYHPPRIYSRQRDAENQSPVKKAAQVFMEGKDDT